MIDYFKLVYNVSVMLKYQNDHASFFMISMNVLDNSFCLEIWQVFSFLIMELLSCKLYICYGCMTKFIKSLFECPHNVMSLNSYAKVKYLISRMGSKH